MVDDKTKFAVELDVSQFHPNELSVNVQGQDLVVEGKHDERTDASGQIERRFVRKFKIPEDVNVESIESHLSDKGVLMVSASKKTAEAAGTRTIPIKSVPQPSSQ